MTSIKDLQERINSAEKIFNVFKSELDELKAELEALKNQEPEQESLLGRWATHPTYGRGIIGSSKPDTNREVRFAYPNETFTDGTEWLFVLRESLTLDPVTLITTDELQAAPEGTIAESTMYPKGVVVKTEDGWYRAGGMHAIAVEYMPTCRVIRWGNGQ